MHSLNLLSPKYKEKLKSAEILSLARFVTISLLIFSLILTAIFYAAKIILQNNNNDLNERLSFVDTKNRWINDEIDIYNEKLKVVNDIQKKFVSWSYIILELNKSIPEGVTIKSMTLDKISETFALQGIADQREYFMLMEKNLKKNPLFREINSPLTNILVKTDVEFQLSGKIILEQTQNNETE